MGRTKRTGRLTAGILAGSLLLSLGCQKKEKAGDLTMGSPVTRSLTVVSGGTGAGKVTSSPAGIDCGKDCTESFEKGTSVTLTAAADAASVFSGWEGASSEFHTCSVSIDSDKTIKASFALKSPLLTVAKDGSGGGTVTSAPSGINCGTDCSENYAYASTVTLTASPDGTSSFAGWSGGGCSGTGSCTATVDADKTVTAAFNAAMHTLSVTCVDDGTPGQVFSEPAGIDCTAGTCTATFVTGTTVTLTADNYECFPGWSGDCEKEGPCELTMDADKSVTADFSCFLIN